MSDRKISLIKQLLCLFIAISCFLYGMAIWAVGSGTKFYAVWAGLGVLFLILGAAIRFNIPGKLPVPLLRTIMGAVILGLIVFVAVEAAIVSHFNDTADQEPDFIIVLGAQVYEDGPSDVLKYRLDKAAEYMKEYPDTTCIVTGAQGYNEPCTEAECMAEYLVRNGISEERIIQEDKAENTVQNIRNSSAFFDKKTDNVGIVTNNFHVFRALHIAKKQGIEHVCGIAADSKAFYLPNNCLREFLGTAKDLVKGNL